MEPARVPIPYVQDGQLFLGPTRLSRGGVERGCGPVAMHDAERDTEFVEHWCEGSSHGSLLTPDFNPFRLIDPAVTPIGPLHCRDIGRRIFPSVHTLGLAGFVHDPVPRDQPML